MKNSHLLFIACITACLIIPAELFAQDLPESWVNPPPDRDDIPTYTFEPSPLKPLISMGSDGKLEYKPYSNMGDRVLDWSKTGYKQSNVPIPDVPVVDTLSPLTGETTPDGNMAYHAGPNSAFMIQEALYKVFQMTPDANGIRGAVLLKAGTYYINGGLYIPSGVVLRGEGDDENGTKLIFRTGSAGGDAITIGQGSIKQDVFSTVKITDNYVPSGSYDITVEDASGFKAGDYVYIRKTVNQKWIDDLGMGERLRHIRGGEEGAGKKPWTPGSYQFMHLRKIAEVNGNTITLDVMIPQSIAEVHGGGLVIKAENVSSLATHSGVESLSIISNYDKTVEDTGKDANFVNFATAVNISNAMDCWVRNVSAKHMYYSTVSIRNSSLQITVRDCKYLEPVGPKRGGKRYSFSFGGGTGHLVYNCFSEDSRHDFAGGSRTMGPFAFVKSTAVRGGQSEPHHRWGTGFLFDNITTKDGSIAAINRGDSGSGHGWAAANAMIWNCDAPNIVVFDPETVGENNLAIGYTGDKLEDVSTGGLWYANTRAGYWGTPREGKFYGYPLMGSGYIESPDAPVEPQSLYIQQLIDRIGLTQAMRVLDDDKELLPRIGLVDMLTAYPDLDKVNDSTFIMKFNKPLHSFFLGPENFTIRGNTGLEDKEFSTAILNDTTVRLKFDGIGVLPIFSELIVDANDVLSVSRDTLEGITTATYVEPDLRPLVTGISNTVNNEDDYLEASSSKPGMIYLVEFIESLDFMDNYQTVDDLEQFVSENRGRKVEAPYADSAVMISTQGLPGGFYMYFAVDEDGRISEPGNAWPEVLQTGPLLGIDDESMLACAVWSTRETIFIKPNDNLTNYSARLFDMTGRMIMSRENMMGAQQLMVPGYRGILIVKLVSEKRINMGTHKVWCNP